MNTGQKYIKTLGLFNVIYVVSMVVIGNESITKLSLTNSAITALINLAFGLGLVYLIYKKKNGARLFLNGISILGLLSCGLMLMRGQFGSRELVSSIYDILCIVILMRVEVIQYIKADTEVLTTQLEE